MTTPTIEVIASNDLQTALEMAISLMARERYDSYNNELKSLLCDVVRARCIKRRYDEQQISLRLPTP